MFSVIKTYKIWFAFSGILMVTSLALLFAWGLAPGIDFRGGTLLEAEFERTMDVNVVKQELAAAGFGNLIVQEVSEKAVIIKTEVLSPEQTAALKDSLTEKFGQFTEHRFEIIGPSIGRELVRKAYWQVVLVCLGIIFYIAYSFRKINQSSAKGKLSSWKLGVAAIIALLHDLIITVGVFVVLGRFRGVEVDSLFVTALLTILGFSVHDTIVVFDRIRENTQKHPFLGLGETIDYSISTTLARSINTSSTLVFVLVAMLLFGGESIFNFILALLIGVTVGTYSSIFIASPVLYLWQKR